VSVIFKRLFRVYAHIYYAHLENTIKNGEEAHLNTCFKHFMLFVFEFNLIETKELYVLEDIIIEICGKDFAKFFKKKN